MKLNAQGIEQVAPFLDAIRFGSVVIIVLRESIVSDAKSRLISRDTK